MTLTPVAGPPLAVLIVVTHLLGVGHLARAAAVARALAGAGHRVTLVSGGRPEPLVAMPGVEVVQLPPVHCKGTDFRTLYQQDGSVATPALLVERQLELLGTLATVRPQVLLTELYPFGRRQLSGEFALLVEAAQALRPRPAILCSIRDILNPPSRPEKAKEALERLAAFDAVLVHGDRAVAPLSLSWPVGADLERRLAYTGYIGPDGSAIGPANGDGEGEVLVTGGGSAAGLPLYRVALHAARLDPDARRWRILVGHGVSPKDFDGLVAEASGTVVVERARPDFRAMAVRAAAVVSQAGYNTAVELVGLGARAVLVPFEDGNEQEQSLRARVWSRLGLAGMVPAADLAPQRLLAAVREAAVRPRLVESPLDCSGLPATVTIVGDAAREAARVDSAFDRLAAALDDMTSRARHLRLWWRDDDAVAPSAALDRLLDLSRRLSAPLALAVIPRTADEALARRLDTEGHVRVLQHGFAHANHAPAGEKKVELGHAPLPLLEEELRTGFERLQRLFGARLLPVLVPPWNRIAPEVVQALPKLGFVGLSTFRVRDAAQPVPGLVQVNTHWDPVAWREGGGLADRVALLDALAARARLVAMGGDDPGEPFGILTHHLVQDAWTWRFLEEVMGLLRGRGRAVVEDAAGLFG
ncbi:glycosyltransferase [Alsobacter sp. R-9]